MAAALASTSYHQVGRLDHSLPIGLNSELTSSRPRRVFFRLTLPGVADIQSPGRSTRIAVTSVFSSKFTDKVLSTNERGLLSRSVRQRTAVITSALPSDSYWITVAQAVAVTILFPLSAAIGALVLNAYVEAKAVKDFVEMTKKGEFREEDYQITSGEGFGDFSSVDDLYMLRNTIIERSKVPRNRPVRIVEAAEPEEASQNGCTLQGDESELQEESSQNGATQNGQGDEAELQEVSSQNGATREGDEAEIQEVSSNR